MISRLIKIVTVIFVLSVPRVVYASCVPSPEPCNDTSGTNNIEGKDLVVPLILVGGALWYFLSGSDEPEQKTSELTPSSEFYQPYSFSLAPLPDNYLGGVQLKFAYEF